jgi:putative sugar O-methyltransferase
LAGSRNGVPLVKSLLRVQDGYYFAQDFPMRIWNLLFRLLGSRSVFSSSPKISDSDSTYYSHFIISAINSERVFRKFRRNFYYRQILEHVNYKLGLEYVSRLSKQSFEDLKKFKDVAALSSVGSPRRFYFRNLGLISPTMIRYQYVSQELQKYFGKAIGKNVVEIGIGFGGQYAILNNAHNINRYTMFDLPQVMELTRKVLNSAGVESSKINTGNIEDPTIEGCDLVISNYAFSELPRDIQRKYIEGVMAKSQRGYLIMNSGNTDFSGRSSGKYTLEELRKVLPFFEVFEEDPLTGPDNYVIVWGHNH